MSILKCPACGTEFLYLDVQATPAQFSVAEVEVMDDADNAVTLMQAINCRQRKKFQTLMLVKRLLNFGIFFSLPNHRALHRAIISRRNFKKIFRNCKCCCKIFLMDTVGWRYSGRIGGQAQLL